jgi:hypothetical protein
MSSGNLRELMSGLPEETILACTEFKAARSREFAGQVSARSQE